MKKIDIVINEMASGKTIAEALKSVMEKRYLNIVFDYKQLDIDILNFNLKKRTAYAIKRAKLDTVADVIKFIESGKSIRDIKLLGDIGAEDFMEQLLNYCWSQMNTEKKAQFLLDTLGDE